MITIIDGKKYTIHILKSQLNLSIVNKTVKAGFDLYFETGHLNFSKLSNFDISIPELNYSGVVYVSVLAQIDGLITGILTLT